jgi:hypothetical protein
MAECDECFICFEATENVTLGKKIDLRTSGCGCSHPVHEWCLIRWYTIYGKHKNECPLCKMPGAIRDIRRLSVKFHDRLQAHPRLPDADDIHDDERFIRIRSVRMFIYALIFLFSIVLGLLYIIHPQDPHTGQSYMGVENMTPWDYDQDDTLM